MSDLFDGNNDHSVNGQANFSVDIPNGAKKFEFWYRISDWQENEYQDGSIDFFFEHGPDTTYESNSSVYFEIHENTDGIVWLNFEVPTDMHAVTVYLRGTFTAHVELYAESFSTETATTTTTGIVRPTVTSAISVVEKDIKDENGNITAKAGDIDVKLGDGLNKNDKGELCITASLSGSNWQNLLRFTNGFIVNGTISSDGTIEKNSGYFFERLASGDLLYKNADRTITIASYNNAMPEYVAPEVPDGEEG